MIILISILWFYFRKSVTRRSPECKDGVCVLESPFPKELTTKLTVKEVYAATNDLKESNFIGQGHAGKRTIVFMYVNLKTIGMAKI